MRMTGGPNLRGGTKMVCRHLSKAHHSLIDNHGRTRESSLARWGTIRPVSAYGLFCPNTRILSDFRRSTRDRRTMHMVPAHDSLHNGWKDRLYNQCEGCHKDELMGRREVRRAGTALDRDHYGPKAMKEGRIHWHAVKLEVVNCSQRMRDRPERDELQSIMIGLGRVKVGDSRGRSSATKSPIYIH